MPRTKRVAARKRSASIENIKPNKAQLDRAAVQTYLKNLDREVELMYVAIESEVHRIRLGLSNKFVEMASSFQKDHSKTIAELKSETEPSRNITTNTTRTGRKGIGRSSSADRTVARSTSVQKPKTNRVSRSLTRQTRNNFVTPSLKQPPQIFGSVTPKVKPNAPQVVLRRPKQGEIAISMQGSPLMVSNIASDYIPNINIPLQDGRMIAIQPERGLRYSDLPLFDAMTQRNLEVLRDNLNKVCGRGGMI